MREWWSSPSPSARPKTTPRPKESLTKRYIDEFGDFIPKIHLSLKNQIAANNKIIGPTKAIKTYLAKAIKERRRLAFQKAKDILKKNPKS